MATYHIKDLCLCSLPLGIVFHWMRENWDIESSLATREPSLNTQSCINAQYVGYWYMFYPVKIEFVS